MPALKKDGSVAEAIALGVIKEHVVARHGAAMSKEDRTTQNLSTSFDGASLLMMYTEPTERRR